jgi:hypothetical protein
VNRSAAPSLGATSQQWGIGRLTDAGTAIGEWRSAAAAVVYGEPTFDDIHCL